MKYYNQLTYPDMVYPTDIDHPESSFCTAGTVSRAGCGLCSACMMVNSLTLSELTLEECRSIAIEAGANRSAGTDMKVLAPEVAKRFNLVLHTGSDVQEMLRCLQEGGKVIVHVGGDREGHVGVFSHGGHYILAMSYNNKEVCVVDPSWKAHKYEEPGREGQVRECSHYAYCSPELLKEDSANRTPSFYMFYRKEDLEG